MEAGITDHILRIPVKAATHSGVSGHLFRRTAKSGPFDAGMSGRFAPEWVAGFLWNQWPLWSGIRTYLEPEEIAQSLITKC